MELDRERIGQIIDGLSERLAGDWLLLGGALVALWLEPRRVTEDIDIVGLRGTPEERYALMDAADDMGLPIEAVNSAADFFVRRVDGWRDEIALLKQGAHSTIYRPTPTLFLLLKIGRLTAQDLADCVAMSARARADDLALDAQRVVAALDALPPTDDAALSARRAELRARLNIPT